jgi:hypothetical protein
VLAHLGVATHQLDGKWNFSDAGAGAVVVQAGIEHRPGFPDRELQIAASGADLLLRYRARILAAVATAGLLQGGSVNTDIDQVSPGHILRRAATTRRAR